MRLNAPDRPIELPPQVVLALQGHGFLRERRLCARDGLTFAPGRRWHVVSEPPAAAGASAPSSDLGLPGLWKTVGNGLPSRRVFEFPAWVLCEQPEEERLDESGRVPFARCLDWALATRGGRAPTDWSPPPPDLLRSWLPGEALTVSARGFVRQGEIIQGPRRWTVRMPILPRLPLELPQPRRLALDELAAEAQSRWAMVRLGVPPPPAPPAFVAEVDLTGAPHSEELFSASLDVLRHVAAWLVETAEVLADPSVEIACLTLRE
jgi:hypothetical protein